MRQNDCESSEHEFVVFYVQFLSSNLGRRRWRLIGEVIAARTLWLRWSLSRSRGGRQSPGFAGSQRPRDTCASLTTFLPAAQASLGLSPPPLLLAFALRPLGVAWAWRRPPFLLSALSPLGPLGCGVRRSPAWGDAGIMFAGCDSASGYGMLVFS